MDKINYLFNKLKTHPLHNIKGKSVEEHSSLVIDYNNILKQYNEAIKNYE